MLTEKIQIIYSIKIYLKEYMKQNKGMFRHLFIKLERENGHFLLQNVLILLQR